MPTEPANESENKPFTSAARTHGERLIAIIFPGWGRMARRRTYRQGKRGNGYHPGTYARVVLRDAARDSAHARRPLGAAGVADTATTTAKNGEAFTVVTLTPIANGATSTPS